MNTVIALTEISTRNKYQTQECTYVISYFNFTESGKCELRKFVGVKVTSSFKLMYIYRWSWLINELTISSLTVNELPIPWPNLKIQLNLSLEVRWDGIFFKKFSQKNFEKILKSSFFFQFKRDVNANYYLPN